MSKRSLVVMQHRQLLLAKISGQREQLSDMARSWQPVLHMADQGVLAVKFMRRHPVLLVTLVALAGIAAVRRSGVQGLVKNSWRIWRTWRYVSTLSKKSHRIS